MADQDEEKILADARKLSFSERVAHKSWKARSEAYDSIASACERALSEADDCFAEYGPLLSKAAADANVAALDKALAAVVAYLSRCSEAHAARVAGPVCSAICKQGLKQRPGTVKRCTYVCLALIELEQGDVVVELVIKALSDKTPKVVVAALDILTQAFSEFGPKVLQPQPIFKALPILFEAKQVPVRDGVKKLTVEAASWLGPDIVRSLLLDKMPDMMRKDIEKLVEEAGAGIRKQPERFTRKEMSRRAAATAPAASLMAPTATLAQPSSADTAMAGDDMGMDAYDFADPVDVLGRLDKAFWEGLSSAKWSERRDALQNLKQLASSPKLAPGDYADVVRELRKVIVKDSNVVCVAEAAACLGNLAKGLRKDFSNTARAMFANLLDKLKDKNTAVCVQSAQALVDFHRYCVGLADVSDDFTGAVGHKNPKLRSEAIKLLQTCVEASTRDAIMKAQAHILPAIAIAANDAAPAIRDASAQLLVAFALKSGSMKSIEKYIDKLDDSRKKKLEDMLDAARKGRAPAAQAAPPPSHRNQASMSQNNGGPSMAKPLSPKDTNSLKSAKIPAAKKSSRPAMQSQPSEKNIADDDDAGLQSGALSQAEVEEKFTVIVGEEIVKRLRSSNWKERLGAMEDLQSRTQEMNGSMDASMLIQGMSHLPGWSEKNFQVMAKAFDLITQIAGADVTISKKDAFVALGGMVPKLSDGKLKGPVSDALTALAEVVGPQFICAQLHKQASAQKNPKVLNEALVWMAKAIEEFGLSSLDVKLLIDWMIADLGSSNVGVRNAATTLLGTAHKQLGPGLVPMLSQHVKPALMTSLNDAFKANPLTKVVPVRQVRGRSLSTARGPSSKASSAPCRADDIKDLAAPDDLLPRTDISASISPSLTDRFVSPKWQERNAALEEVENVLKAAGGRIQPSVNNLVALLKGRLADTNANLVARTLVLAGEVAKAMGAAWDRSAREFLKAALEGLADKKKQVRDGVVTLLEAWVQVVPADRVIAPLADYLNSPKAAGAEGKGAVLRWAATLVKDGRAGCCVEAAIYAASSGVLDKSADARETGSALMLTLLQVHGRAKVTQAANGLSGAAKKAASEALLKVSSSKEGMAVPDVAAVNSYAIAVSCESSLNENDSRPPSRSGPSSSSVASSRSHKNVLQPGVKEPPAAKKGCLAASTRKDERARKHRGRFGKFDPPREEEEESLEAELSPLASETLRSLLFAKNFQKHVEAADVIMAELSASGEGEAVLSCLDLLLRWAVIRLCDPRGNTTSLLKVLDMCKALLEFLDARDEQLSQIEAACFFPCIVEKAGHNNDRIRAQHRELLHVAQRVYPVPRLIEFLSHGLSSKNWRTRVECTEVLSEILALEGLSVFERSKEKPFPVIAQMVSERDSGVRAAALNMIEKLYLLTGSAATWTLLGQLSPQQHSLIEERLKYKDKQDTPMAQASSSVISGVDTYLSSSRVSPGASRLQQQFTPGAAPLRSPPTSTRVSSPQEAAATPRQGTHLTRCHLPTPVPKATPMPRASVQQAPAMVDMLTPLAPSMVARRQETGAEAQLARWETGMDLLQRNKEDDYVEGMKLLSYELMDVMKEMEGSSMPEERVLCHYESCASQLVMELVYKVHMVFEVAEQNNEHARSVRLCTYTLNTLMQVFALRRLALAVPLAPLRELIKELLLRLLDPGTRKLPNATQILKGLNVLMLRVVENSDQTLAICVLIELLDFKWKDSTPEQHAAFADLVVKCLLKPTKALDVNIRDLRVIQVLQALHHFFESLGSNEIRRRGVEEDKPLRMAKTLLHELCKHKCPQPEEICQGPHILDYMPDIPVDCQPDELLIIYQYVEINLKTLEAAQGFRSRSMQSSQVDSRSSSDQQTAASLREAPSTGMPIASARQPLCTGQHLSIPSDPLSAQASSADACSPVLSSMPRASALVPFRAASSTSARDADIQNQPSNVPDAAAHVSGVAPKAIGSTARSALADIFKKIGEKKTSEQGLMELHLFGLKNPDVDFDAHLAKTSANFKAYIESGLKKAARIYSGADKSQLPAAGDNAGHMLPGDGDPSTPRTSSVEQLRARMQRLKCSPASL